ncbi:MAG TPA: iron ABC transporter permease [Rhodocyclaceae bacterium]
MHALRANRLLLVALLLAFAVAMPVASVLANVFSGGTSDTWRHLAATVLPEYVANTLLLCFGVGVGTVIVGTASAWLTVTHDFPGRRLFSWALVLPMAMPAYVMAYVYTDLLQYVGPLQTSLREWFGWGRRDYWFPDVRSAGGAVLMFVCVLYPYVYLLARTAFLERASGMIEAARMLGVGPWASFFRVSLPLARPAIVAGASLALMETLADYGTVSYFAVPTFTTGIYRAWFSLGDRIAAAQLAAALLGFVILLLALERLSRGRAQFHDTTGRNRPLAGRQLRGWKALAATLVCALPLFLGFVLPALLLGRLALSEEATLSLSRFAQLAGNSVLLAGVTALFAVALAVLLGYSGRLSGGWPARVLNRLVSLGYAVPGSVIAVGVLIPVTRLDNWLAGQWMEWFGVNPGLLLTGGIAALVYAYLVRLLSVALQTVQAGLTKITRSMDDAARSLGASQGRVILGIHVPLLRGTLFTAMLLVFVDVMKELPATLVMRPFNLDTLATQTYTFAADERLAEAALPALAIVAVGLLPLMILSRQIARQRAGGGKQDGDPAGSPVTATC